MHTIQRIERDPRSFTGKIIKWVFILFNILMIVCIPIFGIMPLGWAAGTVILGALVYFTRGKTRIVTNIQPKPEIKGKWER